MVSIKDVAKLAGVSMMTVSRVINHAPTVHERTKKRVQAAITQLNYVPDHSAQKIRNQASRPRTIAILAEDTATTPYSVDILLAIEQTARSYNWNSYLINIFGKADFPRAERQVLSLRPDAIICTTMGLRKILLPSRISKIPTVLANCFCTENHIPAYLPNDHEAQFQATQHILQRGYLKPLCLWLPEEIVATHYRRHAFETAWRAAGLDPASVRQYVMPIGDEQYTSFVSVIRRHIHHRRPEFDVILCGNDRIAFLVYQVLLAEGIRIPQDVAVVGFDNMVGIGDLFMPPLTTIQLPHHEMGRQAALHIILERKNAGHTYLPTHLIIREST
ncbi:MAG: Ribose operon repressor [Candidatus Erwinia impunctatus]|nr:Ribose operon repressor [Culicoides impunctatus]